MRIRDGQVSANAGMKSTKINFFRSSNPTAGDDIEGTPTSFVSGGNVIITGTTGAFALKVYDNGSWSTLATQSGGATTDSNTFTVDNDSITGKIIIDVALGAADKSLTLTNTALTDNRVITFPDATGTVALTTSLNLTAGADGTAGTLTVYPATATNGAFILSATNNGAARNVTLKNAAHGQASVYTIPDCGAAAGSVAVSDSANMAKFVIGAPRTLTLGGDITTAGNVTFTGAYAASFTVPSASTWVLPTGGGTLALASGAETGTTSASFTVDNDSAAAKIALSSNAATGNFTLTLVPTNLTANRTVTFQDSATQTVVARDTTDTLSNKTLTAPVINGASSASGNFDISGSTGTFKTSSGTNTLSGNVVLPADVTFDQSASAGTFKTGTGAVTLNGHTSTASGKNLTVGGSGTFITGTGAVTIKGSATFDTTKTLTFGAGAGGTAEPILMYSLTASNGSFAIACCDGATNQKTTLTNVDCAAATVISLPNATSTLATLGLAESFSGVKTFTAVPVVAINDANNTTVTDIVTLTKTTSGAPGAGIGLGLSFIVENDTDATTQNASIDVVETGDGTKATMDTDFIFSTMLAGTVTETMRIDASDQSITIGRNSTDANGLYRMRVYPVTASRGSLILAATAHASADRATTITNATDSSDAVTVTLPNATGTLATLGNAETFSGAKTFSAQPTVLITNAGTSISDALCIGHATVAGASAGIGVGMTFYVDDLGGSEEQASIDTVLDTVTDGQEDASFIFNLNLNGDMQQAFKIDGKNQTVVIGQDSSDADGLNKLTVYPNTTTAKGSLVLQAVVNNAANVQTIIQNGQSGATSTFTLPTAASGTIALCAAATGAIARSDITEEALASHAIPVYSLRAADGAALGIADTQDSGDHYLTYAAGVWALMGNSPSSDTQTDVSLFQFQLPPNYVAAGDVKLRVNALYTTVGDTQTVDLNAYEINKTDGTKGGDICATTVITLTATATAHDFTITATDLVAGDLLSFILTTAFQDADGAVGEAKINSVELLCDVKG